MANIFREDRGRSSWESRYSRRRCWAASPPAMAAARGGGRPDRKAASRAPPRAAVQAKEARAVILSGYARRRPQPGALIIHPRTKADRFAELEPARFAQFAEPGF